MDVVGQLRRDRFPSVAASVALRGALDAFAVDSTRVLRARMTVDDAWVDAPTGNFGWIMIGNEVELQNAKRFSSRQSSEASVRPRLTIDYTPPVAGGDGGDIPLPAWALVLLGGGLAAALGRRRNGARHSRAFKKH